MTKTPKAQYNIEKYSLGFSFKKVPEVLDYEFILAAFPAWKPHINKPDWLDIFDSYIEHFSEAKRQCEDNLINNIYGKET